jgi:hypothetical protein
VGRNVVDNFETAMRRYRAKEGLIVAFSFGKGSYEEVARAELEEGLKIRLTTVNEIAERTKRILEEESMKSNPLLPSDKRHEETGIQHKLA